MSKSTKVSNHISLYFDALQRIVEGKPVRVDIGTAITLNAVSLEAGRSLGSIKKSRPIYAKLIESIMACAAKQNSSITSGRAIKDAARRTRVESDKWKDLYHQSLARELMLLHQLDEAEQLLHKSENIFQFSRRIQPADFEDGG